MNLKRQFVIPAVLMLAACTRPVIPPTTVHVETPALREYFSANAPGLDESSVRRIRICDFALRTRRINEAYTAFIEFEDGSYTSARLAAANFKGNLETCRYELRRKPTTAGAPRKLQYLVRKDVVDNNMFNDSVKDELRVIATTISDAIEAKKNGITPAQSWGVNNLDPSTSAP
jgi:hypothetical protein